MATRPMTKEEQTQWQRTRLRGRLMYVLGVGVGLYGSVFATLVLVARLTVLRSPIVKLASVGNELMQFVLEAILFGLWAGFWTWQLNQKRFRTKAS